MRRLILPLACYLGVTVGMPILDGNMGAKFVEHVVVVAAGCLFAVIPFALEERARRRRDRRPAPPPPRSAATSTA